MTAERPAADVFSADAVIYDRARRKLIPCFDDFYGAARRVLADEGPALRRCLDLGAGTGLMTTMMLRTVALEEVVLVDKSADMIAHAEKALSGEAKITAVVTDMPALKSDALRDGSFDAIWSALAIHHLDGPEKRKLFARAFALLSDGGVFINADQSLGRTPAQEARYRAHWLAEVRRLGAAEADVEKALARMREDRMDPLEDQLRWLEEAGFEDVGAWFQNWSFNVYSGRKKV